MLKWNQIAAIAIIVILFVLIGCLYVSQFAGEKTISTDSAVIPAGGQKTYSLPPGYVTIHMTSNTGVDETFGGFGVSGSGHNRQSSNVGIGSVAGATYTITNSGGAPASVSVSLTTGFLNFLA